MNRTASWRKLKNTDQNSDNMLRAFDDAGQCCADSDTAVSTLTSAATNVTTSNIASIVIDAVTYTFAAVATTGAELLAATQAAMISAGYAEVYGSGTSKTGADTAVEVSIVSTATITVYNIDGGGTVAFS